MGVFGHQKISLNIYFLIYIEIDYKWKYFKYKTKYLNQLTNYNN
ncbi:MAG: hypothetical protein Barrevirus11_11 [Barrevirus sp.]|uniref:Uncharacterized protein n=1 Tax=Barrevirus sp. TaxID=2487763 RepID=A0A3G4ZSV3_9VIRU|nr:MAG: hypothetical protein Barrevirus11_11 [Barrevirus sp.]